ncbi:MAG: tRNA (adenosine(37)-N6)-threonylcarbamoyltransferase complex transferase subunit TsaD [Chitinophagaceae bacterium]|nr:tRNA (adenosine(37)-N6)-threonylcarbamoyltransferase complex transferase subunit TsaD [Chitinophagaceae bacterium]
MPEVCLLAIESSCDETSAAILSDGQILSNIIYTQTVHEKYGGVIPESASRLHIRHILPVVEEAFLQSGMHKTQLHAVAYTQSPGLIGSLLVGATFAKSFAQALTIPTIAVNHMHAHVLSNLIEEPRPDFPFLCLTVSGGHTQIVLCRSPLDMEILGETIDDAAGEAFDKSAKMLGLPYPGGPLVDRYAQSGDPMRFQFAKPRIEGLNFSFSGVKTSILYFLQAEKAKNDHFITENINDLCAGIQHTIVTILMEKLVKACKETGIRNVCIAGGVSANSGLRKGLQHYADRYGWKAFIPKFEYCTDNAAMIAMTGYYKYLKGEFSELNLGASARSL